MTPLFLFFTRLFFNSLFLSSIFYLLFHLFCKSVQGYIKRGDAMPYDNSTLWMDDAGVGYMRNKKRSFSTRDSEFLVDCLIYFLGYLFTLAPSQS
jgi:hypothetical protein